MKKRFVIYLAGPLFTQAERIWNKNFSKQLSIMIPEAKIILPQAYDVITDERNTKSKGLVGACIRGLDSADVVVAVLDGSDADSGTSWECGYAYARGKQVIGVRTDLRASEDEGLNAMLRRT